MLADGPKFCQVLYIYSNFIGFAETSFNHFNCFFFFFFFALHRSPSIGKPRMTPVSFVKTTELYEVSLVTINRQTSYDSGSFRQEFGIIRGLPMNITRFADWVIICVVHLSERT